MSGTLAQLAVKTNLAPVPRFVLVVLALHADDDGRNCFPKMKTLIAETGYKERAVQSAIALLWSEDHIECQYRPGKGTLYRVHPRTQCTPQDMHPAQGAPTPACGAGDPRTQCGTPPHVVRDIEQSSYSSSNSPLTAKAHSKRKASKPKSEEPPPSNLSVEAWHRWVQYRKGIRKALKPASIPAAQRQLAAYGTDQVAVVEQSIANGWTGIFELKRKAETPAKKPNGSHLESDRTELEKLMASRESRGIASFRDPYPHETPAAYETALRMALRDLPAKAPQPRDRSATLAAMVGNLVGGKTLKPV